MKDATNDTMIITEWWDRWPDANIGIATGRASGVVVLDVDPRHDGDSSIRELEVRVGAFPPTAVSNTGGGGRHYWFRAPEQVVIRNSTSVLGRGLDFRADGGYAIAPPSNHASGGVYGWKSGSARPAPLPDLLLQALLTPESKRSAAEARHPLSTAFAPGVRTSERGARVLRRAVERIHADTGEARHDRILRAAIAAGRAVALGELASGHASFTLVDAGLAIGKPRAEVVRTVRDGLWFGIDSARAEFPPLLVPPRSAGAVLNLPRRLPSRFVALLQGQRTSNCPEREMFTVCVALARAGMGTEFIARAVAWSPLSSAVTDRGEAGACWLRKTIVAAKALAARDRSAQPRHKREPAGTRQGAGRCAGSPASGGSHAP